MQRLDAAARHSSRGNGVLLNQVCYDIRGPLDASAFHRAWDALVAPIGLRTAFLWEGLPHRMQVRTDHCRLPFQHVDLTDATADAREAAIEELRRENADAR
jgi:hypothetical protein